MEGLLDSLGEVLSLGVLADVHVELCDLVGVHAGRRDLDGSRPVEVVVAEVVGELLDGVLLEWGVVEGHVEVSGQHAALGGGLRHQVEVVLDVGV